MAWQKFHYETFNDTTRERQKLDYTTTPMLFVAHDNKPQASYVTRKVIGRDVRFINNISKTDNNEATVPLKQNSEETIFSGIFNLVSTNSSVYHTGLLELPSSVHF